MTRAAPPGRQCCERGRTGAVGLSAAGRTGGAYAAAVDSARHGKPGTSHSRVDSGGVGLAVCEAGPRDAPPVILLHGWAQSSRAWRAQLDSPLAQRYRLIAADLRGHGDSDVPSVGYTESAAWAGDLAALLDYVGTAAVLLGWSYGGLVITDYLRVHGTARVAGVLLAGAITELGRGRAGGRIGATMRAALPAALSADPVVAEPALRGFVAGLTADPLPSDLAADLTAAALSTPAAVRAALFDREVDSASLLAGLDVPATVLHGSRDTVVDPRAGHFAAELIPGARFASMDCGHAPFLEAPQEFNGHLAELLSMTASRPR
ncbi:MAG: alpha/beta fold hydrolase [Sciscionella sp.]